MYRRHGFIMYESMYNIHAYESIMYDMYERTLKVQDLRRPVYRTYGYMQARNLRKGGGGGCP